MKGAETMKTKTITLYKFSELSEEAQDKAVNKLADINIDDDWWDYTYSDAENIGLEITEFDTYHGTIKGKLTSTLKESIDKVMSDHGNECETYKTAQSFCLELQKLEQEEERKEEDDRDSYEFEQAVEDLEKEYTHAILEDYLIILRDEYEYQTSKKAIIETIEANDYDFTEDGEID